MIIQTIRFQRKDSSSKWEYGIKIEAKTDRYIDSTGKEIKSLYNSENLIGSFLIDLEPMFNQLNKRNTK